MPEQLPREVADKPASARLIWLMADEPRSIEELADRTGLSEETVRLRARELKRAGILNGEVDLADTRKRIYWR